ncbi:MAG TPA: four helix bundle protein [Fimbriimonadaceae bacterium]|nr:four helix bundle protein [Fimbriimonadaceae bacterium]
MTESQLKDRTKQLASKVLSFTETFPRSNGADIIAKQLVRSATSVAANYRSACRGRSDAEMSVKLGIVEEEADESQLWLELVADKRYASEELTAELWQEFDEIVAIMVASRRTIRGHIQRRGNKQR